MTSRAWTAVLGGLLFVVLCIAGADLLERSTAGDLALYREYGERTLEGEIPYRDFFVEYPPGALAAFVAPALAPLDYELAFRLAMAALGLAAIWLVRRAGGSALSVAVAAVVPLALGPDLLTHYDLWPAALALAAVAGLLADRPRVAGGALGLAVAAKVYPVALVPVLAVYALRRHGRGETLRSAAVGLAVLLAAVVPFLVVGPGGLRHAARFQLDRPLHVESLGGSLLLAADKVGLHTAAIESSFNSENLDGSIADAVAGVSTVVQLLAVAVVAVLFARGPRLPADLVGAAAAAVTAFVAFGKVLSPQFLVWLAVLVPLVPRRAAAAATLLLAALASTRWLERWDGIGLSSAVWVLLARNALLVALFSLLLAELAARRRPA
jgi:Glycosyltransferase family 87